MYGWVGERARSCHWVRGGWEGKVVWLTCSSQKAWPRAASREATPITVKWSRRAGSTFVTIAEVERMPMVGGESMAVGEGRGEVR